MAGTRIKEERFSFIDPQTGKTILVYEPESNDENKTVEDVSKLTFYISPLCLFNVAGNLPKPIFVDNAFRYTFELKCYPQRIIDYAAEMTTRRLKGQIGGAVISSGKVSPLPIQSIEFKSSLSGVEFEPLVSDSNDSALGDLELVVVKVSQPYKEIFENIVTDPVGLKVQVGLKYNVLNTQDATLTWSVEDIQSTLAYKDLLQAGGNYVSAKQIQKVVRDAATIANARIVAFPGMQEKLESALANVFSRIFDDFANIFKQEIIKSREEAAALDRKIIEGTGLNSNEFKPIVLFFDIVDKLKTIDDFQSANEFIRKTYNEDTTGMDFYFEYVGESFFGSLGLNSDSKSIRDGLFKNSEQYHLFKERVTEIKGQTVEVVLRGIKLLEKGDFVNNLRKTASFVVVEVNVSSISLAISTNLRAGTIDDQEIRELSLLKLIKQTVPIGTIFAYASDAVPEGFLVCDGSPLKANDYPELYEVLSTIHGNGIDSNSVLTGNFNLPDYRGMFLRGWDPIGINDPDFNTRQSPRSGANEGNRVGSIQNHHVQAHDHLLNLPRHINIGGRYSGGDWSLAWESHDQFLNNPPQRVGENGGKETRPKNAAVNFIIKVL